MEYVEEYNLRVRRINALVAAQENLLYENTLDGLGGKKKKKKLTREEKAEQKRLAKIEKEERRALHKLTSKKERKKIAKRAKKARKKLKSASGFIGDVNELGPPDLPLTPQEEIFRAASIAGDFSTMNQMLPFGPNNYRTRIPLGKYRFILENGQQKWIPFTERDVINFLNGPWLIRSPTTGLAPLLHPRRKKAFDKGAKVKKLTKRFEKAAKKYPATNMKHVSGFSVGEYTYKSGLDSTWVKVRAPVMIAVAIVASVYLGPAILQAVQAGLAKAGAALGMGASGGAGGAAAGGAAAAGTGGGAVATGSAVTAKATLASKVFAGAKTLSGYVNNARTAKAIIKGEEIPPPVGVSGENFAQWSFKVAQDEAIKAYGRKLTKDEERDIKREIAQLQSQLAPYVKDVPLEQPPEMIPEIKKIQDVEIVKDEKQKEMMQMLIPAAIGFLVLKGVA
jgi:hypothetical protein